MATWGRAFFGGALGFLLMATFLGVVITDGARLDYQLTGVADSNGSYSSLSEQGVPEAGDARADWSPYIHRVDEALTLKDVDAARRAWREAYVSALRSRRWEGIVEVGDASLRIGEAMGARRAAEPQAREAYLQAIARARAAGSVDGVLRATEAFAALGDREVVSQGVRIAERLAARSGDARARQRVHAFSEQLATDLF